MWSTGSGVALRRFQSSAQKLWGTGSVAPHNVESSWTRDQTSDPCVGRWVPIHCSTWEVLCNYFIIRSLTPTVRFSESGSFRGTVFSEPLSVGILRGWSRQHPLERCYACFCQTKGKGSRKSFLHLISQDRKDQSVNLNRLPMYRQICSYKFSRRLSSPSGGQAETHQLPHQPTVLLDTFLHPFSTGLAPEHPACSWGLKLNEAVCVLCRGEVA